MLATRAWAHNVDGDVWPQHRCRACLQSTPKALPDPSARLRWGFDHKALARQVHGSKWLQPDAIDGIVDGLRELCSYFAPDVLELCAHGSDDLLLAGRKWTEIIRVGPAKRPVNRIYPSLRERDVAVAPLTANGEKFCFGDSRGDEMVAAQRGGRVSILQRSAEAGLPRPPSPPTVVAGKRARPENIDYEAHLSAQETQASSHTRVSCPYAHPRGKAHAQAAAQ